jgi:hypothetical protein
VHGLDRELERRRGPGSGLLAGSRSSEAANELDQAGSARVHDACLAQHVELLLGPRDRLLAALDQQRE